MTPLEIRIELKRRTVSQSDVARAVGVHVSVVGKVIDGDAKSRRVALTIANFLGRGLDDLWPGKYPDTYTRRNPDDIHQTMLRAAARMAENKISQAA